VEILVVDDHVLICEALRDALKDVQGDATVSEALTLQQSDAGHCRASRPKPHFPILLNLNLPDRERTGATQFAYIIRAPKSPGKNGPFRKAEPIN
jgi:hypothetical protein